MCICVYVLRNYDVLVSVFMCDFIFHIELIRVGKAMDKDMEESVRAQAMINRKEGKRPLSDYQKQI